MCVSSSVAMGYFSLFASLNLPPGCEGRISSTVRTLPLVFQGCLGLATWPQSLQVLGPFYCLKLQDSKVSPLSLKKNTKHCRAVNFQLTSHGAGGRTCKSTYVTKKLSPEPMKNSIKLNRKKTNSPVKVWAKDITKEDTYVAVKHGRKVVRQPWLDFNSVLPKSLQSWCISSRMRAC